MVNNLDLVFGALGSPVRRAILMQLESGENCSVSDLAAPLKMKLPAMLKHLDVLETARLITKKKSGRTMYVTAAPAPLAEASRWLQRYEHFWSHSLAKLATYAEKKERQTRKLMT
jgi:DNA-binding transcriptional ArsR family regulator